MNTTERLQSLLYDKTLNFDFRFDCGYSKPTHLIELKDKDEFVQAVWLHNVLFGPYAELEQLRKGFQETLQIQLLVCMHGQEVRAPSTAFNVTVNYLQEAFAIHYSDSGSNKRTKEETIVFHWLEYITNCKGNISSTSPNIYMTYTHIYMYITSVPGLPCCVCGTEGKCTHNIFPTKPCSHVSTWFYLRWEVCYLWKSVAVLFRSKQTSSYRF